MRLYRSSCDECGWAQTRWSRSRAHSDSAFGRHSCRGQRRRDAARLRRVRARAKIDRTPKPCLHKVARHRHGTYACYVLDACRCRPCSKATSAYGRDLRRRNAYGRSNYVDAGPARAHVRALMAAGVGLKRIAAVSGVAQCALWNLMYGKRRADGSQVPSGRVTRRTEERLLAVHAHASGVLADRARIDATGTRRRLQALGAVGWSVTRIAAAAGHRDRGRLDRAMHQARTTAATAREVSEVYERLWSADPGVSAAVSRVRAQAAARGWVPPLGWDDDTIDDPAAAPAHDLEVDARGVDEAAVQRRIEGDRSVALTRAERWAVVARMHGRGLGDVAIERVTGIHTRQVLRDRQRLGLPANDRDRAGDTSGRVA